MHLAVSLCFMIDTSRKQEEVEGKGEKEKGRGKGEEGREKGEAEGRRRKGMGGGREKGIIAPSRSLKYQRQIRLM